MSRYSPAELSVPCPYCGARPGEPCHRSDPRDAYRLVDCARPHKDRRARAKFTWHEGDVTVHRGDSAQGQER